MHSHAYAASLLLWPHPLSFDHCHAHITPLLSWRDPRAVAAVALYAALVAAVLLLLWLLWRATVRMPDAAAVHWCQVALMALAVVVLTYLPASHVFVYTGVVVAERLLLLPRCAAARLLAPTVLCSQPCGAGSLGSCLLVALCVDAAARRLQRVAAPHRTWSARRRARCRRTVSATALLALCIAAGALTVRTNIRREHWGSEAKLFRWALLETPESVKALSNTAAVLLIDPKAVRPAHAPAHARATLTCWRARTGLPSRAADAARAAAPHLLGCHEQHGNGVHVHCALGVRRRISV